jgi:alkylhydroperoxidase family enzyme
MPRVHVPAEAAGFPTGYVYSQYAPKIGAAAAGFSVSVYEHSLLSPREMEGARYRTAQINGCTMCMDHRASKYDTHLPGATEALERPMHTRGPLPGEEFYAAVKEWRTSPMFSTRERLTIEFSERMGQQPQSFQGDEAFWTRLHAAFSDAEIVDLTLSVASWIAMGRATHVLGLDDHCRVSSAAAA